MHDPELQEKLRTGGQLVASGIVLMMLSFLGTCSAVMSSAGDPNPGGQGLELGQSPWLLISLTISITLIVLGQVRKSNARRDSQARYLEANTKIVPVLDPAAADGPFRGSMKELEVLDPAVAAAEATLREQKQRRGAIYMTIGGLVMVLTVVVMLMASATSDYDSPQRAMERVLVALGLSLIPFGLGMFLTIKGLLLRAD